MTEEFVLRLLLAMVAGALVGVEREVRGHVAGIRTHALVSTGAALFTVSGIEGAGGTAADPMRVAAQVVSGIGFVGAGAIMRDNSGVRGLTTASTIWVSGALGVLCAVGNFILAGIGMAFIVLILSSRRPVRWLIHRSSRSVEMMIGLEYEIGHGTIGPLIQVADETDSSIVRLTMNDTKKRQGRHRHAELVLRTSSGDYQAILDTIDSLELREEVKNVRFEVLGAAIT